MVCTTGTNILLAKARLWTNQGFKNFIFKKLLYLIDIISSLPIMALAWKTFVRQKSFWQLEQLVVDKINIKLSETNIIGR